MGVASLPVQCDCFGLGTVETMVEMTAGKRERETVNTRKTERAWTQICLKIVQYGGDTSNTFTLTEALTADGDGGVCVCGGGGERER